MPCTTNKRGKREKVAKQKDDTRFNCPYPGCDRRCDWPFRKTLRQSFCLPRLLIRLLTGCSCAELWRLKVHFRWVFPPNTPSYSSNTHGRGVLG